MSESTDLKEAITNLTNTIAELRKDLVRKDVYAVDQKMMSKQIDDLEGDLRSLTTALSKADERRAADRRLILTALVLPVLLIIIQLYLAAQTGGAR